MAFFPPELLELLRQANQHQGRQRVDDAAQQPIPGFTGPPGSGAQIPGGVGMIPPNQPPLLGSPPQQQFTTAGPYGQQALQLAGLLGGGPKPGIGLPVPVGGQQINAGLGAKRRMPHYRPVGK